MFSLVSGFVRWLCAKEELNVLIVGLDHAGKTTLLEQMKGMYTKSGTIPLSKIPPTIGLNVGRMTIKSVDVTLWDLGGQASMRTIWSRYCADAGAVVYVVDAADRARLSEARASLDSLLDHTDVGNIPLLVMANKQDLAEAISSEAVGKALNVSKHADRGVLVTGVSALTCEGVHSGICWLVDKAMGRAAKEKA